VNEREVNFWTRQRASVRSFTSRASSGNSSEIIVRASENGTVVATRKGAALRAHWLDVAIVVVTVPLFGQLLSSLRLVRLVRLLRLLRAGVMLSRALQAERALTSASAFRGVRWTGRARASLISE